MSERIEHWEGVYATTSSSEVSWFEREPVISLRLLDMIGAEPSAAVIDIGAGASLLVDHLVARGFTEVTVLDLSQRALAEVRQRLGERERHVTFVQRDVLTWQPDRRYDVWHDRAVFHFLTEREDCDRYVVAASQGTRVGGHLVLATFAEDGPTSCSGLPASRYSGPDLASTFSPFFTLVEHEREEHLTPGGAVQPFTWVVLQRT